MVKAIIDIDKDTNKTLNVIKAEYGLNDKSEAIEKMAEEFKRFVNVGPEVRPEYAGELKKMQRGSHVKVKSVKELRKRYGLE